MLFPLTRSAPGEPIPPGSPPLKPGTATADGDDAAAPPTPLPAAAVDRRAPIAAGDTVIVYESHTSMKAVRVTDDGTYGNRFGQFRVKVKKKKKEKRGTQPIFLAALSTRSLSFPS